MLVCFAFLQHRRRRIPVKASLHGPPGSQVQLIEHRYSARPNRGLFFRLPGKRNLRG
ncbi:hypothetical protein BN2476_460028 [Paraburkholderia piptadeniae]|uniref:Uncharacterized protein n=1 Tax=Paraburkholderia piptadeniae TaxID=1701573 RepID=A0A1N7SCG0_9BURK|nr:hypothetical protein BN2476_460028 [Paraburkholderia piptadeniae]